MGFRYDFQKRGKAVERQRKRAKGGKGKGYKSSWSPIKFMNPDLDRSSVVTVLKYFFCHPIPFFCLLPHRQKYRRLVVSEICLFAVYN